MTSNENLWKYGGVISLVLLNALALTQGVVSIYAPMPFYLIILAWVILPFAIFLTPLCYFLVFHFGSKSPKLSLYILVLSVILGALNAWFFYTSWDYGIRYQGEFHTKIVAIWNVVGFAFLFGLAIYAHMKQIRIAMLLANFLLFALLSWCAFPYLGELP